jgi:general secretion pathway protein K
MKPALSRRQRAQHGMAVIAALLVVSVAAVLTAGLFQRQATLTRTVENDQARAQARWLLLGGMDWARMVLRSDARRQAITHTQQLWATPVTDLRVSRDDEDRAAFFSGYVEDEQGKYNLTNLAKNRNIAPTELATLQRLLSLLELPGPLANRIALRVATAQAAVSQDTTGDAAQPQAPGLQILDDLRTLEGVSDEVVRTLRPFVTILPVDTALNPNTASAEVLSASVAGLSLTRARQVVAQRDQGQWFNDRADFLNRLGDPDLAATDVRLDTQSQWFLVTGSVALDRAVIRMQSLVERSGRNTPRIVWRRELN